MKIIAMIVAALWAVGAHARVITLTMKHGSGSLAGETNGYAIAANETVEVAFLYQNNISVGVNKDGLGVPLSSAAGGTSSRQALISGPATVSLWYQSGNWDSGSAIVTLEILPQAFPPDKTIVIPAGGGANIALECSTNLIDWTTASAGVYTNQPAAKFFRIKAERVP